MDMNIQEKYYELEDTLTDIVRCRDTSYWIIWLNVAELVHQSDLKSTTDCLGSLMNQVTGTNRSVSDIECSFCDKSETYQQITQRYRFGNTLSEWGDYWKELVIGEKPFRLKRLWGVLNEYRKALLPYCNRFISEWETEQEPDIVCNPKERNKEYRRYREMIKKMQETILTVIDVIRLMGGTLDVL